MIDKGVYVRCPADYEDMQNPRIFISGQLVKVNDISNEATVVFHDPFQFRKLYGMFPKNVTLPLKVLDRCEFYKGSVVEYDNEQCIVLEIDKKRDKNLFYYYLQSVKSKEIYVVREDKIISPFTTGKISPVRQLSNYEFQNPCWYFGRSIVSRTMNILENSIYGFKELAGCKIFLMPHQLKTIMRCLQEKQCRYMLADEVGLGKTIEACSVLKVFMNQHANAKVLIVVPYSLLEQWKVELFIKFYILVGKNERDNEVNIISIEDLNNNYLRNKWDFIIVDEAHRLLNNNKQYQFVYSISKNTENILFLSATPVQQKKSEYLKLLKLIVPDRYDSFNDDSFDELLNKQNGINKTAYILLGDLEEYQEILDEYADKSEIHEDEDCKDLFNSLVEGLKKIGEIIGNSTFGKLCENISFDSEDYGIRDIQIAISYICENYQIEKNIIRNRRFFIENLAQRNYIENSYSLDRDMNTNETNTYFEILKWVESESIGPEKFEKEIIPLLASFFSSPWAFNEIIVKMTEEGYKLPEDLKFFALQWEKEENQFVDNMGTILEDPDAVMSRIVKVIDYIDQEIVDSKAVIFTNYNATFDVYKKCLLKYFREDYCAFFNKNMARDELELNVYKFQKNNDCKIMLCDESGGEGRNFQCADYVVHIDLPWDANAIEQRIGRLDRIGRDSTRDVVSVLFYTSDTIEEQLFKFWNKGLNIFTKSLSGLEIIMKEINERIISAITNNFRYGLEDEIDKIIEMSKSLESSVRDEQHFDTAAYKYNVLNIELERTVDYYTRNENELFTSAMMNWAELAGLRGIKTKEKKGISFDTSSFSVGSAIKTILIPPNWEKYLNSKKNVYVNHIMDMYEDIYGDKLSQRINHLRKIEGTFSREEAIEKDYLHFFAPSDDIFDCVVDNALKSCKGQVAAFAVKSQINWRGIIFTWSIKPNEKILLDTRVPIVNISHYRNFLSIEHIDVAIPFADFQEIDEKTVLNEFRRIIEIGYENQEMVHFGKREKNKNFLNIWEKYKVSNLDYIKAAYPEERWRDMVQHAAKQSKEIALKKFRSKSNIAGVKNEISKAISTKIATNSFYDRPADEKKFKKECELLYEAFKTANMNMESACLIWLVK